jgi:hypothetical protein
MKIANHTLLLLLTAGVGMLTGCVDDNYDLSDIDTLAQVKVKDLVLPVNIDPIRLDALIEVDENNPDAVIKIQDGKYIILEDGEFSSSDIVVEPISITPASISTSKTTLIPTVVPGITNVAFDITSEVASSFGYSTFGISDNILSLENVGVDWTISVRIATDETAQRVEKVELQDFKIMFPKGLTGKPNYGSYDAATGIITIDNQSFSGNNFTITMPVSKIDIAKSGVIYNSTNHSIWFSENVGVKSGRVYITEIDNSSSSVDALELTVKPIVSNLDINSFTGSFSYSIANFNVPSFLLNNIPDVLVQDDTNIYLVNPQLYLAIDNPLSKYGVTATTDMTIVGERDGVAGLTCTPDDHINIGVNGANGYYTTVLAPTDPSTRYSGYDGAVYQKYTSLGSMLSGKGVPTLINIDMVDPRVEETHVTDFALGNLGKVTGHYTFYAPLELSNGSVVAYSGTEDDLGDDVANITIETLTVTADAVNTLPFDVTLELVPYNAQGKRLDASVQSSLVPANSSCAVTMNLTGAFTGMTRFDYVARGVADDSEKQLTPDQAVTLKNVKATVNGYYEKEL